MLDKERVKELYLKGYSAVYISNILNCKPDAVRQCIHRNLKVFKTSILANKIRNKEIDRITRHEANQYMSNATFIKKNRSIYKTTSDGDIVIDVCVAPVISFDTPKKFKNENSITEIDKRIRKSDYKKDKLFV